MAYFERVGPATFRPTEHVGGAWNTAEQHIGPALGLLAHAVEVDREARRGDGLLLARLSWDILGTVPMEPVEVTVSVPRPGRTVELVEAVLSHEGRPAVRLRAWLLAPIETASVAGGDDAALPAPEDVPAWDMTSVWAGGFIGSTEVRRVEESPGRARSWVRTDVPLLDEPVSPTARVAGLLDIANGLTARADPAQVAFPNVDLTAHLHRQPEAGWLGFDTVVSFGPTGQGVTSSTLHDAHGPFGTMGQTLTVRPTGSG